MSSAAPSPRPWRARAAVLVLALGAALLASELAFRLLGPVVGIDRENLARFEDFVASGGFAYEPRPHTVFARHRGTPTVNSAGFSDIEWTLEKAPGVPRILCLGASTTEGGNAAGREGSYPFLLERELERRTARDFEVMNAGISGWTSAETLVAWFLTLQDYAPDLVVVHLAANDVTPRNMDGYRPDYTHWRHPWYPEEFGRLERALIRASDLFAWLRMEGKGHWNINLQTTYQQPAPHPYTRERRLPAGSEGSFRRNVESIGRGAERRGAAVLLLTMPVAPRTPEEVPDSVYRFGVREHNRILRELAARHGWLLADAEPWPEEDPAAAAEFLDLVHLLPAGNAEKARIAAEVLEREWVPTLDDGR